MLAADKNALLTQVGRGTPMGELMRRYWQPVAAVSEFDDKATKPIRLMGEDLVMYKDLSGNYGLIDQHCQHRSADLSYGYVEKQGLRCNYHGWLYDANGRCVEQPFEDTANPQANFKDRIRIKAYPVEAKAGLLWAYLGPEPRPLVPTWEPFTFTNGFVQIVFSEIPCNWFQCQENSIDPVHFEWMHSNWRVRLEGKEGPYSPKHLKIKFEEFKYGLTYKRIRTDTDENDPLWTVGRVCLWPNALFTGGHFEYRVPVDDHTTMSVGWFFNRVPKDKEPYMQTRIPSWVAPIKDPKTGRWIDTHVMNQDFIAWVGQGAVTDRARENLASSDRGVVMMRKRFFDDLEAIKRGEDPIAIVRDPKENVKIDLPIVPRKNLIEGMTLEEVAKSPPGESSVAPKRFVFLEGQPEAIRREYAQAMGVVAEAGGIVEKPR